MRRPLQPSMSSVSLQSNGREGSLPSSPSSAVPGQAVVVQAQLARRVSNGKSAQRIPPPLHLAASAIPDARLPQAYQSHSAVGNGPSPGAASANLATYGARSSSNAANASLTTGQPAQILSVSTSASRLATSPGLGRTGQALPPPKGQLPLPPSDRAGAATSARQQLAAPSISTTAASPTSGYVSNQPGDYASLRSRPRPTGGISPYSHRKAGSTGGSISSMSPTTHIQAGQSQARPSTAAASYQQQQAFGNGSNDAYLTSSGSGSNLSRSGNHGYKTSNGSLGLSPITEASSTAHSPVSAEAPTSAYGNAPAPLLSRSQQQQSQGYTVGKGGFARPTTAGGTVSIGAASGSGQVIPLEDVMRKTVKFIADDNVSKMVNVEGAKDVQEVLLRVLKKFGRIAANSYPTSSPHRGRHDNGDLYAEMEGYGVFSSGPDGASEPLVWSSWSGMRLTCCEFS